MEELKQELSEKIKTGKGKAEEALNKMVGRDDEREAFIQGRISAFEDVLKLLGEKKYAEVKEDE